MDVNGLIQWFRAPLVTGRRALVFAIAAVAIPTIARAAFNGVITGCEFTPYIPFVLLSAIALGWWQAGAIALASVAIMDGLFLGSPHHTTSPCFIPSAGMFLASSAIMIGIAVLVRLTIVAIQARGADESSNGVVFSLEKGQVWASWYGQGPPMRLGTQSEVSEMMDDFLKQVEHGKRFGAWRRSADLGDLSEADT